METDLVGLGGEPGEVEAFRTLCHRADAVLPVEARDEVPAGIAHQRNTELFHGLHHIGAEAELIRQRVTGFIDAAVDRAAQVLDKGAEDPLVDPADPVIPIQNDFCLLHSLILSRCRR